MRQTILLKQVSEELFRSKGVSRKQALATEQIARVTIRDGQGVAVATIAGLKLPFEIDAPDVIGGCDNGSGFAGMPCLAPLRSLSDQPFSFKDLTYCPA